MEGNKLLMYPLVVIGNIKKRLKSLIHFNPSFNLT